MIALVIASHAAAITGVEVPELYGRSHRRRPTLARHIAWYVMHKKYGWDYYTIAREFNRERATVMKAIESVEDQIILFPDVRDLIRCLSNEDHLQMLRNYTDNLAKLAPCPQDDQRNITGKKSNR